MSIIWLQSSLEKMPESVPANSVTFHTRTFLQTFVKVFSYGLEVEADLITWI